MIRVFHRIIIIKENISNPFVKAIIVFIFLAIKITKIVILHALKNVTKHQVRLELSFYWTFHHKVRMHFPYIFST